MLPFGIFGRQQHGTSVMERVGGTTQKAYANRRTNATEWLKWLKAP
jgi:hypothetical protein